MSYFNNLIIAAAGKDAIKVQELNLPCLNLAYSISNEGMLVCDRSVSNPTMSLMGISNIRQAQTIKNPQLFTDQIIDLISRLGFIGVFADFEPELCSIILPHLDEKLHEKNIPLYIPYTSADYAKFAHITIETAISGGIFKEYLTNYIDTGKNIAANIVPVCSEFILPAQDALGKPLTIKELNEIISKYNACIFFSHEMVCNYFTFTDENNQGHFVIFDDERTINQKISILSEMGIKTMFILYPHFVKFIEKQAEL